MLVVLTVPLVLNAFGVHGVDPYTPLARSFDPVGFAVLCAVTLGAAVAMGRLEVAEQLDDRTIACGSIDHCHRTRSRRCRVR